MSSNYKHCRSKPRRIVGVDKGGKTEGKELFFAECEKVGKRPTRKRWTLWKRKQGVPFSQPFLEEEKPKYTSGRKARLKERAKNKLC
jgi:hypothetical protein